MRRGRLIAETARSVLGWLISACLLLQPLWVPLHLFSEEHAVGHCDEPTLLPVAVHGHSHAAAGHGHDHRHASPSSAAAGEPQPGPHCPHPAEDHLGQSTEPVGLPKANSAPLLLPTQPTAVAPAVLTAAPVAPATEAPSRPPPRHQSDPRAPPAA